MPRIGLIDNDGECVRWEELEATYGDGSQWGYRALPRLLGMRGEHRYRQPVDVSVTGLAGPIRKAILEQRHDWYNKPADLHWMSSGSGHHLQMELHAKGLNALPEEQVVLEFGKWRVGGTPDLYQNLHGHAYLYDYKRTSKWKVIGVAEEGWSAWLEVYHQLNLYALALKRLGFRVDRMFVQCEIRDWHRTEVGTKEHYPPEPDPVLEVPPAPEQRLLEYATTWLRAYEDAKPRDDAHLPLCSADHRWEKPSTWAVKKAGNKRATAVFESEEAATQDAANRNSKAKKGEFYNVEHRPGEWVRCEHYCDAAPFCSQYINHKREEKNDG